MTDRMRKEYTDVCNEIFRLLMSGVSEDSPEIVSLRELATTYAELLEI